MSGIERRKQGIAVFVLQLVLNFTWSWIFFGAHRIGWALVEIVVLWLAILLTIILFARRSVTAATLLVPYLLWVTFATALNTALWRLNA